MSAYDHKPRRFLERLVFNDQGNPVENVCCAGFELSAWRCKPFADHLIEWLPEYALPEEELDVNHANIYIKLRQAAIRVYTSDKYKKRGEVGEIGLHAICREYFGTIPISPRVFYKSTSNDVIKAFDLVHARILDSDDLQLWLGESKLYEDSEDAIAQAIKSVLDHLDQGFLDQQKILLGPQIPKGTPHYDKLMELFAPQTSLDKLIRNSIFVIGIFANSPSCATAKAISDTYVKALESELQSMLARLKRSGLTVNIKVALVYVPLASKAALVDAFDKKLKALQ